MSSPPLPLPLSNASAGAWLREQPLVIALLVGLNVVRFAFAPFFDLVPQEAYYFLYSQHLALSYFDHPPVLAYMLRLFTEVFGPHELSIRLAAFSMSLVTQYFWVDLARRHLGSDGSRAALLLLPTGMVTVTALISTPDVPLLLFWTLAVHQLHGALFENRRSGWVTAGVAMGLAFDSKYTGIFLQAGLGLFLLVSAEHRRWLRTPWPWLSIAIAQGVMAPVYIWNFQNGFASFLFQTANRASQSNGPGLSWTLGLLGSQSVLLGVPLFIALLAVGFRPRRLFSSATPGDKGRRLFLACFFAPAFLLFCAVSFFALVKPNWLMPAYLTGVLLAADLLRPRWVRANLIFCGLLHVLAAIQLLFYPVLIKSDDTWLGWRELSRRVEERAAAHPGAFVASSDGYKTTAVLRFYSDLEVYGPNLVGGPGLQFDYIDRDLSGLKGRDAIFIDSAPRDFTPARGGGVPGHIAARFRSAEEAEPILIADDGRILRKFRVYLCRGYLGE